MCEGDLEGRGEGEGEAARGNEGGAVVRVYNVNCRKFS